MSGCPIVTILATTAGRPWTIAEVGLSPSLDFVQIDVKSPVMTAREADDLAEALRLAANELRRNDAG